MKDKLIKLIKNTKSEYFNYPVVAIMECKDGSCFNGVNIETSSPAAGVCAERCAIYNAISNGYKKDDFLRLHLMAASCEIIYPCFICRQTLVDFCNDDMEIVIYDADEDREVHLTVNNLTPYKFDKEDL